MITLTPQISLALVLPQVPVLALLLVLIMMSSNPRRPSPRKPNAHTHSPTTFL